MIQLTSTFHNGYVRVAAAIPQVRVANCAYNADAIIQLIQQAADKHVSVVLFPELSITGYSCADLFFQERLLSDSQQALEKILLSTCQLNIISIIGMPWRLEDQLYNVAVVIEQGKILGIVPKTHLPNHNEFYEKRWFRSSSEAPKKQTTFNGTDIPFDIHLIFKHPLFRFGIEICEDLWVPLPPSTQHCMHGAELIFNLSATNELIGKHAYLLQLIEQQSARCKAGYIYASSGFGESTTDLVYGGNALIAENGLFTAKSERFTINSQLVVSELDIHRLKAERLKNSTFFSSQSPVAYTEIECRNEPFEVSYLHFPIPKHPFIPSSEQTGSVYDEVIQIQVAGLAKRWLHTGAKALVVGVSGGLDSTWALQVCIQTADKLGYHRPSITGITMPGFGTSERTYRNAIQLMKLLGITVREIPIDEATKVHFKDIGHDFDRHDVTFENAQARERTQILMDVANQLNGLVIGTGNLSELALGWTTYNGDHMSMYAVNGGVPKTLMKFLVEQWALRSDDTMRTLLHQIVNTPVSPELIPANPLGDITQKTENIVGPYELHDFFLYYHLRYGFHPQKITWLAKQAFADSYSESEIQHWLSVFLQRFNQQQFKRSCMPDGPKVSTINLSPRGDWRMPSDADFLLY